MIQREPPEVALWEAVDLSMPDIHGYRDQVRGFVISNVVEVDDGLVSGSIQSFLERGEINVSSVLTHLFDSKEAVSLAFNDDDIAKSLIMDALPYLVTVHREIKARIQEHSGQKSTSIVE